MTSTIILKVFNDNGSLKPIKTYVDVRTGNSSIRVLSGNTAYIEHPVQPPTALNNFIKAN